jgi:hypothetical protein
LSRRVLLPGLLFPQLSAEQWWIPVKAKLGEVVWHPLPAGADKVQTICQILIPSTHNQITNVHTNLYHQKHLLTFRLSAAKL